MGLVPPLEGGRVLVPSDLSTAQPSHGKPNLTSPRSDELGGRIKWMSKRG
jgi:hypothetical protein